jgi:hypothetical protein
MQDLMATTVSFHLYLYISIIPICHSPSPVWTEKVTVLLLDKAHRQFIRCFQALPDMVAIRIIYLLLGEITLEAKIHIISDASASNIRSQYLLQKTRAEAGDAEYCRHEEEPPASMVHRCQPYSE